MPKTSTPSKTTKKSPKVADQYDLGEYNYLHYWDGRDYENAAETMAIRRLLRGKHFASAADVGGGYGRLCVLLEEYADKVTLAEPSRKQLEIAKDFLKGHPKVAQVRTQADDLQLKDGSQNLITMIRVMHHLPNPTKEFKELNRVLAKDGILLLEVANYTHFRNKLKHAFKGQRMPKTPVDIRSEKDTDKDAVQFVNHNPRTVIRQLEAAGFQIEKTLSVSNLRSPGLKKVLPHSLMLAVERVAQPTLAKAYFGPSVFFVARKVQ